MTDRPERRAETTSGLTDGREGVVTAASPDALLATFAFDDRGDPVDDRAEPIAPSDVAEVTITDA